MFPPLFPSLMTSFLSVSSFVQKIGLVPTTTNNIVSDKGRNEWHVTE